MQNSCWGWSRWAGSMSTRSTVVGRSVDQADPVRRAKIWYVANGGREYVIASWRSMVSEEQLSGPSRRKRRCSVWAYQNPRVKSSRHVIMLSEVVKRRVEARTRENAIPWHGYVILGEILNSNANAKVDAKFSCNTHNIFSWSFTIARARINAGAYPSRTYVNHPGGLNRASTYERHSPNTITTM